MRRLALFFLCTFILLLPAPAAAQPTFTRQVGAWEVTGVRDQEAMLCMMAMANDEGSWLRIVYRPDQPTRLFFRISDRHWSGVRAGQSASLVILIDDDRFGITAQEVEGAGQPGLIFPIDIGRERAFLDSLIQRRAFLVRRDGRDLARFALADVQNGLQALVDCGDAIGGGAG
jgi:hypothetical protein